MTLSCRFDCGELYATPKARASHERMHQRAPLEQEIDELIDRSAGPGACWPWMGHRDDSGYGRIVHSRQLIRIHRFVLERALGRRLQVGQVARHVVCDNPPCANPRHLAEGTPQDNIADKLAHGRQARGTTAGRARLTEADVLAIRRALADGATYTTCASTYGVSKGAIEGIAMRRTWAHLPEALAA